MRKDLTWLQKTVSEYSGLEKEKKFEVTYFLESSGQGGGHGTGTSSMPLDDEQGKLLRMTKTHGMMIRFLGAEDHDFGQVKQSIERIMTKY
jgi:hypothetical protein